MSNKDRDLIKKIAYSDVDGATNLAIRALCRWADTEIDHAADVRKKEATESELHSEGDTLYVSHVVKESKPMKATILIHKSINGDHWTAGDQTIEISSSENLTKEVFKWMMDNRLPRKFLRNVHYDGMLFEYTSNPVLAEVGTGIEI